MGDGWFPEFRGDACGLFLIRFDENWHEESN